MKVKEFIEVLKQYNQEADFDIIVQHQTQTFSMAYGGAEGVSKENCENVCVYVDKLNSNDKERS